MTGPSSTSAPGSIGFLYLPSPSALRRKCIAIRRFLSPECLIAVRLPWGGRLLVGNTETGNCILNGTYNEQVEINIMRALLRPGMTVFDLGANLGLFTVVAARAVGATGRVHAFEPGAWAYDLLKANCGLNRLENVTLERLAVSDQAGETEFYEVAAAQAEYSSMRKPAEDVKTAMRMARVPTTDLGSYVARNDISTVHFIKMDIEGGERDAIKGGASLLGSACPPMLLLEVNDRRTAPWGYKGAELLRELGERSYAAFRPTPEGLVAHKPQEAYEFSNFLLVPRTRMAEALPLMAERQP